jgi:hypothetical protein
MDYQLLKVNNITKLCDDRIIHDQEGKIQDLQWFDFQLHILCDVLKISIIDNLHCHELYHEANPRPPGNNYTNLFTRNQIFRAIKEKYRSIMNGKNEIVIIPDEEFTSDKLTSEELVKLKNAGLSETNSFPLFKPTLDKDNQCKVLPVSLTDGELIKDNFYTTDASVIEMINRQNQKMSYLYDFDEYEDTPESLIDVTETEDSECLNYGKLSWIGNSCYIDSALFLLFLRMHQNPGGSLAQRILETKITKENINDKRCLPEDADGTSPTRNKEKSADILDRLRLEVRELFLKFSQGVNTNVTKLRTILRECNSHNTRIWATDNMGDSEEFLRDLFQNLQIKYPSETPKLSGTNKLTTYYFSKENPHLDYINDSIRRHGVTSFDLFYGNPIRYPDGNIFDDKDEINNDENKADLQFLDINLFTIQDKFIFNTNIKDLISTSSDLAALDAGEKFISDELDREFKKTNTFKIKKYIKISSINIDDVINSKSDNRAKIKHMKDPDYEFNDDYTQFFKKDEPDKLIDLAELGDKGFDQALAIEHPELDNQTEDIFIFLRKLKSQDKIVPLKIDNIQDINVDGGTKYLLNSLVYWKDNHYMTMFTCNNEWYKYDDGPGKRPNIIKIGNYDDLMKYEDEIVKKHTTIYHYVRE